MFRQVHGKIYKRKIDDGDSQFPVMTLEQVELDDVYNRGRSIGMTTGVFQHDLFLLLTKFKSQHPDGRQFKIEIIFKDEEYFNIMEHVYRRHPEFIPFGFELSLKCDSRTSELIKGRGLNITDIVLEDGVTYVPEDLDHPHARMKGHFDLYEGDKKGESSLSWVHQIIDAQAVQEFLRKPNGAGPRDSQDLFNQSVNELYNVVRSKYGALSGSVIVPPEMMDNRSSMEASPSAPILVALAETMRLQMIMNSDATKQEKFAAVEAYQNKCQDSWPTWLFKIFIHVALCAACVLFGFLAGKFIGSFIGAGIGITLGITVGAIAANRICSFFYKHEACVERVTRAALEQLELPERVVVV